MWLERSIVAIILLSTVSSLAEAKNFRFGGDAGVGTYSLLNSGESLAEGPVSFSGFGDYLLNSRVTLGIEHQRSLQVDQGQASSAVALTGFTSKHYLLQSLSWGVSDPTLRSSYQSSRGWAPFIGLQAGISQTSIRAKAFDQRNKGSSVGIYGGVRIGFDVPWDTKWGFLGQTNFTRTLTGTGVLTTVGTTVGFYMYL